MILETLQTSVLETIKSADFIIGAAMILVMGVLAFVVFKRAAVRIIDSVLCVAIIASLAFGLKILPIVLAFVLMLVTIIAAIVNAGIFRMLFANPLDKLKTRKWFGNNNKFEDNVVYDKATMIKEVSEAVANLSKTKTGALITFERKDSLDDYIKTGSIINAPITKELIQTIFYPGTRLHDGAIVIRDNLIVSASVYYTPTTKPLVGKYGARHRAALGVSETTDSVTVIVSEETGRISIAVDGELFPVTLDSIERTLEDYLEA